MMANGLYLIMMANRFYLIMMANRYLISKLSVNYEYSCDSTFTLYMSTLM